MKSHLQVSGHTLHDHSAYMPGRRTDYELVVELDGWSQHEEAMLDFFLHYDGSDLRRFPAGRAQVIGPQNCARMWVTKHFGEQWLRFEADTRMEFIGKAPEKAPDVSGSDWKIWIIKATEREIVTAKNAAWELYQRCSMGKLSVEDARWLLREKFPKEHFAWHQILSEFDRLGGRHTEKYLRREH